MTQAQKWALGLAATIAVVAVLYVYVPQVKEGIEGLKTKVMSIGSSSGY